MSAAPRNFTIDVLTDEEFDLVSPLQFRDGCRKVAAALLVIFLGPINGALQATSQSSRISDVFIFSNSWGAVAASSSAVPSNETLVLIWTVSQGVSYETFDVVNVGSSDLTSQTFQVTNTSVGFGNAKPPVVTFEACIGGAWVSLTSCSGAVVLLGTSASQPFSSMDLLPAGERVSVRASTNPGGNSSHTSTVDILIARDQVRSGVSSSS